MVTSREDTGENHSVDDTPCRFGSRHFKNNGERGCVAGLGAEVRVCVWDIQADEENREDVEKQDTPEDVLDNLWHVACRVFGLSSGDGDGFSATV